MRPQPLSFMHDQFFPFHELASNRIPVELIPRPFDERDRGPVRML